MTANRPSPQHMPAEEPARRRTDDDAHLRPPTRTSQLDHAEIAPLFNGHAAACAAPARLACPSTPSLPAASRISSAAADQAQTLKSP